MGLITHFLAELRIIRERFDLPWLLAGDFNIIQAPADTRSQNLNLSHMLEFNHTVAELL
jgi:exonuclease III